MSHASRPSVVNGAVAVIRDWLQEQGFHPGALSPQTRWNEDLGLTSLEAVELLVELEDRLGLSIPDADAKRMITIQDLLDHVTSTVGPRLETRQKHAKPLALAASACLRVSQAGRPRVPAPRPP